MSNVTLFPAGQSARPLDYEPGDFILTRGEVFYSRLIRLGQYFFFGKAEAKYCRINHAALIVSKNGDLIEALGNGVCRTNISHYQKKDYIVVNLSDKLCNDWARNNVVQFAKSVVGDKYDWATIISICLMVLTAGKLKLSFGSCRHYICSGLVASALTRTALLFDIEPTHVMPAHLAIWFDAVLPEDTGDYK